MGQDTGVLLHMARPGGGSLVVLLWGQTICGENTNGPGGLVRLCITIYKARNSFLLPCETCSEVYKKATKC